jgi:IS30 family transposase
LVHSIISDNGTEFTEHKYIAKKLGAKFYFAHPNFSWERGLNDCSNKLIRQYIPKKSDFNSFSNKDISEINLK